VPTRRTGESRNTNHTSGKTISSVEKYIWYTPFIPVYLTPMYILYIATGVIYVLICINAYQYILHARAPILIWTDFYQFVAVFIHAITSKYFMIIMKWYRSMDMMLLHWQDGTLLIRHYCICPYISGFQISAQFRSFSCQCSHTLEQRDKNPTALCIRQQ
jgi:hypothetical protein